MDQGKIGVRYAKALLMLGKEIGVLDALYKNVTELSALTANNEEFKFFIHNPVIKPSVKISITEKLFKGKINDLLLRFLILVIENKREAHFASIFIAFSDQYHAEKGIKAACLTTAVDIDSATEKRILEMIKNNFKADVELEKKVNKDIIGGFVLKIDDLQYDTSIASKLRKIKSDLLNTGI